MLQRLFGKKQEVVELQAPAQPTQVEVIGVPVQVTEKSARDRRDEIALRMYQMTVTQQSHEAAAERAVMLADALIKALDKVEGQQ